MNKKLRRSKNQIVGGVCAGIANLFGWDFTLVRALYALFTIISVGTGLLLYIILWIIMPEEE
ncbi:MAG: PspC domain-containing protein [Bacteroidota bacterium]|nr:PspC domain-containing protein [Bacteroidota bacterium]